MTSHREERLFFIILRPLTKNNSAFHRRALDRNWANVTIWKYKDGLTERETGAGTRGREQRSFGSGFITAAELNKVSNVF